MVLRNRFDPMDALIRLQNELEAAFQRPAGVDLGLSGRGTYPPVNVFSDDEGLVIRLEVPGFAPADLEIKSQDRTLTVAGKRSETAAPGSPHRRERWSGEFSRAIQVPAQYDLGRTTAESKHGVLTVRVPVAEAARPRQISIQAS